ncbi:unnamed protein product [Scytosiphon promiscuus]
MSRWLGMRRSGERTPTSPKPPATPGDVDAALRKRSKDTPRKGRRRSSEETVGAEDSRRSSQAEEDGDEDFGGGAKGDGAGDVSPPGDAAGDSDWEVLEHTGELSRLGLQAHDEGAAAERPLSPGVDFSTAYVVGEEDGERPRLGDGAAGGKGEDGCKWEDAGRIHSFLVRGPSYMQDKAKLPAGAAMCRLVGFDCFTEDSAGTSRIDHIASRGTCRERVEAMTAGDDAPFLFIMNIQVRGTPPVSMVAYWAVDRQGLEETATPEKLADGKPALNGAVGPAGAARNGGAAKGTNGQAGGGARGDGAKVSEQERIFLGIVDSYANLPVSSFGGDDCSMMDDAPPPPYSDERNTRFKLIPRVIGGPWMVRKAVGSTPVLLGTKITHRYYRGERYVETDMDTGSSPAAASLCGRCRGLSRKIDVELGIVLQANSAQELPEALLGAVRLNGFGVEDPKLQTKLFPR